MSANDALSIFAFPTRVVFGAGALRELGEEAKRLGIRRPLLVTDREVVQCGIAERILAEGNRSGLMPTVFDGVHPNPIEQDVLDGLERYRAGDCDGMIGLGGGSALDTAKAIRLCVTHALPLEQYDGLWRPCTEADMIALYEQAV